MGQSTLIGKTTGLLHVQSARGQKVLYTNTIDGTSPDQKEFDVVSGSTLGTSIVADLTFGATYPLSVEGANACPYGPSFNGVSLSRAKVTNWFVSMLGVAAWTTMTALELQDTLGYPLVHIPVSALATPNGLNSYIGPVTDSPVGISATAASYNATTGAITFPASSFVSTGLVGSPFMVIGGTGAGQTGTVKTNTATLVTPNVILQTALDATSVVMFFYINGTGQSGTTITYQSNVTPGDLSNNYSVIIVSGTGAGQVRSIASSSFTSVTTTLNVAAWTTNPDSTSKFMITQIPEGFGIIDFTKYQWAASTPGQGLQWNTVGTAPAAGSPLRYGVHGYWSDFG